ncbi:hypothetical protein [Pseudoclavibacter sp. RFBB5]|uniref:DUF7448 domain-containing protein n=1 Tax=Pseudoclavibacter sp. RFBB5 TaxID=2080574 RepID=UPI000CE92713|nr:hypothetical protein [Pseudoclavibacter sp. RFBB5]PPG29669.1 hypothetical protein C5B97_11915 [Pseudoclavibacter sp. RFBB5]
MGEQTRRSVGYDDEKAISAAITGRTIAAIDHEHHGDLQWSDEHRPSGGYSTLILTLDDGTKFVAQEADGGCACSNGCFSVEPSEGISRLIGATILNATVDEHKTDDYGDSAVIKLFVYVEGLTGAQELFSSEGTDNGYYGWGYHLFVEAAS